MNGENVLQRLYVANPDYNADDREQSANRSVSYQQEWEGAYIDG